MRSIIQQGGIYLINPFYSGEILIKKSKHAAFNENLTRQESAQRAYKELQYQYDRLSEKILPIVEQNQSLHQQVTEQHTIIKQLLEQLNGKADHS